MKLLKILVMALGLSSVGSFAQELVIEELPVATINENYLVTLPAIVVAEAYLIDISHLTFESEEEAEKLIHFYLTANLIRPELHYDENYVILRVNTEYFPEGYTRDDFQFYLNHLTKP